MRNIFFNHLVNCQALGEAIMSISFFFRCFIYTLLVSIMIYGGNLRKIGIFAWRIGIVYSIFDLILVFFISEPWGNRTFTFLLLLQCILVMPLVSPLNTCDFCGHRMYWHTIFSNKCPHCGEKI